MLPVFTELRIQGVWTGRYKQFNTVCVQVPLSLCMYLLTVNSLLISSSVKIVYGVKIFLSVILQLKHSLSTLLSGPNIYLTSGHNTLLHNTAIVSPLSTRYFLMLAWLQVLETWILPPITIALLWVKWFTPSIKQSFHTVF